MTHFFLTTKHQPQLQTLPPDTSRSLGCWLKELYIPARIPWDQETADLSGMYRNDRNRLEKKMIVRIDTMCGFEKCTHLNATSNQYAYIYIHSVYIIKIMCIIYIYDYICTNVL